MTNLSGSLEARFRAFEATVSASMWLACLLLGWVLFRLCSHHPRRWRRPAVAAAGAALLGAALWWAAARWGAQDAPAAFFFVLTWLILALIAVPLVHAGWQRRGAQPAPRRSGPDGA